MNDEKSRIKEINKYLIAKNDDYASLPTPPQIQCYFNPLHEAIAIGQAVQQLHSEGVPYKEIAILYRNHKQVEILTKYFKANAIPFNSKRRINILHELLVTKLVKILTYLNAEARRPYSGEEHIFEILNFDFYKIPSLEIAKLSIDVKAKRSKWRDYLSELAKTKNDLFSGLPGLDGRTEMKRLTEDLEYWTGLVNNITVPQLVEKIIAKGGILSHVMQADDKRWQMQILRTFFDFVKEEAAKNPRMQLSDLLKTIERYEQFSIAIEAWQILQVPDSINLITTHSSKGLEFEHVFITNCLEKAWFTGNRDNDYSISKIYFGTGDEEGEAEENRRLFYVAMTRAKKSLTISYHQQTLDTKVVEKLRFIEELVSAAGLTIAHPEVAEEAILKFEGEYYQDEAFPDFELIDHAYLDTLLANYTLSATHLNSYLKCPTEFYFNHVLKVPSAKSEGASFGTAIHYALENLFTEMQKSDDKALPPVETLVTYFEKSMYAQRDSFTEEAYERRVAHGRILLPKYYSAFSNQWEQEKVVSIEKNMMNIEVAGVPIKGKLDKIVFEGNSAYVIDFKTGDFKYAKIKCSPPKEDADPNKPEQVLGGDYWRQMVFYNLLIENDHSNKWTMTRGEMNFVEPDKFDKFDKVVFALQPDEISIVTEQVKDTYARVKAHEFTKGCNEERCHWCNFVKYYLKREIQVTEQLPGSSMAEE